MPRTRRLRGISSCMLLEERAMLAANHGWQVHSAGPTPDNTVEILDVDNDGDFDFVTTEENGPPGQGSFYWYENLGSSQLGPRRLVYTAEEGATGAIATDMDFDGRTDLLLISYGFEINLYHLALNKPDGFHVSDNVFRSAYPVQKLEFTDVNRDGIADALITTNLEDRRLELITIDSQGNGTRVLDASQFGGFGDADFLDVDDDNDLDIVTTMYETLPTPPRVVWYENVDGNGTYLPSAKTLIEGPVNQISVVDFDQDGKDDLLVNRREQGVFPYKNLNGQWTKSARLSLQSLDVRTAFDIDNDGDLDLLGYEDWHENEAGKYVTQSLRLPVNFLSRKLVDMDSDGTLDFYDPSTFQWYEFRRAGDSTGDGRFCSNDLITAMIAGKYLEGAANFNEGDWNGDGLFNSADLIFALAAKTYQEEC